MGLSHFSADGTVFYSGCIKLSVHALYVSPEVSEQMMRTIARGGKALLNQHLQKSVSAVSPAPAPTRTVPRTFSRRVLPHAVGRLHRMFHLYIKIKNSNKNLAHMKNRPFGHMVHYAYSFNY